MRTGVYIGIMLGMWLSLTAAAGDADDPFVPVKSAAGCDITMRPESHPEGAAMRAVCTWPEVAPGRVAALITDFERYPAFVFPIAEARVVRTVGDRTLVYQRQRVTGLADREVLLWMSQATDGVSTRVSWQTAHEEPLVLAPGAIRTPRNVGFWEVAPAASGGSRVVHEIALDAGGVVPRWLVNLVRTHAFARILAEVRVAVRI